MALSDAMLKTRTGLTTASDYQMAIFRHGVQSIEDFTQRKPVTNAVVQAVAGSGKTTTIVAFAKLIPTTMNAIFLAFNKSIATELQQRLPKHVAARTLNSLGFGILRRYVEGLEKSGSIVGLPSVRDWTDGRKTWKIMRDLYTKPQLNSYGKDVAFLVAKAKSLGIVPAELEEAGEIDGIEYRSANGLKDTDATWRSILLHFGHTVAVDAQPTVFAMVRRVLTVSIQTLTLVDFDDQKYLPVIMFPNGREMLAKKFDAIIIDEVQDVNAVDILLVKLSLKNNGVVMGVGDKNQSIYGFRGAATDAIAKFSEAFNCIELPLSITYRCATAIVDAARAVYPTIEAAPGAPVGTVEHVEGEYDGTLFSARNEDMILCRNNAPIVDFAYKLIRARVPVYVKGRDIGKGLISLIESMKADSVVDLSSKLMLWQAQQVEMILNDDPDNEEAVQRINDRYETVKVFISENADGRVDSVVADIERLFNTESNDRSEAFDIKGKVVLSTVHKAKGLEADRVFFLDSHLLYPRWVQPGTWQEVQEANLEYVAITRAKNTLTYIDSKGLKD